MPPLPASPEDETVVAIGFSRPGCSKQPPSKATHPVAFAEAFAIATAQAHDAVLLMGDPEILACEGACEGAWTAEDVRWPGWMHGG